MTYPCLGAGASVYPKAYLFDLHSCRIVCRTARYQDKTRWKPPSLGSPFVSITLLLELRLLNLVLWRWNASRSFASFLDKTKLCRDRTVLELGAGGALPSIIAVISGASKVVVTDYPDSPLIDNICHNVAENIHISLRDRISVEGYIWGQDTKPLRDFLPLGQIGFDIIILSDLIFNHSQHDALLNTCEQSLSTDPSACVLAFYTHHRPHLAHRDMEFFKKAIGRGWKAFALITELFPVSDPF